MSFNLDRTRRNRLYWLLDLLLAGELTTERFAQEFHRTYVIDMEEAELSAIEHDVRCLVQGYELVRDSTSAISGQLHLPGRPTQMYCAQ